jgi:hypothetical protein
MSSYFRSFLAEILPGWAFWRSSPRPTKPLDGAPLGKGVEQAEARKISERTPRDTDDDQPPADPDSLNRRL